MAQKVLVSLVDDIDGSEATETISFGMEGAGYEIDVSAHHAEELREKLDRYIQYARKVRRESAHPGHSAYPGRSGWRHAEIREWLVANGYGDQLKDRGRIPGHLIAQYEARIPNQVEKQSVAPAEPVAEPAPEVVAQETKPATARRPRKPSAKKVLAAAK